MYDLLIKNGQVVTPDLVQDANIAVKDGKIAAILAKGDEPEAAKVIDAAASRFFLELLILTHILMIQATSGEKTMNTELQQL